MRFLSFKEATDNITVYRLGITGAVFVMVGTLRPSLFAIFLQPKQPEWQGAAIFVAHYHGIQSLPIYFGFLLIGGSLIVLTTIFLLSKDKLYPLWGLIFGVVGAAIVSLNYIIQTPFIPAVVAEYTGAHAVILEVFQWEIPHPLPGRLKCGDMDSLDSPHDLPQLFWGIKGLRNGKNPFYFKWNSKYCRSTIYSYRSGVGFDYARLHWYLDSGIYYILV